MSKQEKKYELRKNTILTYLCEIAVFYQVFERPSWKYHMSVKNTLNQDSYLSLQEDKNPILETWI